MSDSLADRLKELSRLRDEGLITPTEFESLRSKEVAGDIGGTNPPHARGGSRGKTAGIVAAVVVIVGGLVTAALTLVPGQEEGKKPSAVVGPSQTAKVDKYCNALLSTEPSDFGFQRSDSFNTDLLNSMSREAAIAYQDELAVFGGRTIVERLRLEAGTPLRIAADRLIDADVALATTVNEYINYGNYITIGNWIDFREAYEEATRLCQAR